MRITSFLLALFVSFLPLQLQAQRRSGGGATLVIQVSDPSGAAIGAVRVTVRGAAAREARTERGRIVFEGLPAGNYRLRFERDGFVTLERELVARPGPPIDVKVTLTPAPASASRQPSPPIQPVALPVDALPIAIDMPSFIEKNFVGRAAGKTSPLACGAGGPATLLQLHEPIAEHTHPGADEFLYVIAGEGSVRAPKGQQPLRAGVFVMVPRGVPHALTVSGRSPLVVLSIKAGERCVPTAG